MLGGIGFTWEHDAHLYLRRAMALRQLLGGGGPWRAAAARGRAGRAAPSPHPRPARRRPRRSGPRSPRSPTRSPRRPRRSGGSRLADAGLIVPHWAPPWGRDATAIEQLVIDQELRRVKVRVPAPPGRRLGGAHHRRLRHHRAAGALGPAHAARHDLVVPALQRARGRLRPRRPHHHRHPHRRRLAAQRPEGVDEHGQGGRLGHLPGPHQPHRAEAPRHHLRDRRHEVARPRHPPAARDDRPRDVQRGVPRRRVRPRRLRDRRGRRRLAAGPHDPGQRARVDGQRRVLRRRDRVAARSGGRVASSPV